MYADSLQIATKEKPYLVEIKIGERTRVALKLTPYRILEASIGDSVFSDWKRVDKDGDTAKPIREDITSVLLGRCFYESPNTVTLLAGDLSIAGKSRPRPVGLAGDARVHYLKIQRALFQAMLTLSEHSIAPSMGLDDDSADDFLLACARILGIRGLFTVWSDDSDTLVVTTLYGHKALPDRGLAIAGPIAAFLDLRGLSTTGMRMPNGTLESGVPATRSIYVPETASTRERLAARGQIEEIAAKYGRNPGPLLDVLTEHTIV